MYNNLAHLKIKILIITAVRLFGHSLTQQYFAVLPSKSSPTQSYWPVVSCAQPSSRRPTDVGLDVYLASAGPFQNQTKASQIWGDASGRCLPFFPSSSGNVLCLWFVFFLHQTFFLVLQQKLNLWSHRDITHYSTYSIVQEIGKNWEIRKNVNFFFQTVAGFRCFLFLVKNRPSSCSPSQHQPTHLSHEGKLFSCQCEPL